MVTVWQDKDDKYWRRWRRLGPNTNITHVDQCADDDEASICGTLTKRWWFGFWRRDVYAQLCGGELSFFASEDADGVLEALELAPACRVEIAGRSVVLLPDGPATKHFAAIVLGCKFPADCELWRALLRRAISRRAKKETMAREKKGDLREFLGAREATARRGPDAAPFDPWKCYDLARTAGSGSYGVVVEAVDRATGRKVAIKKVMRAFEDLTECRRLARELRLLHSLSHRNVLPVYDAFRRPETDDVFLVSRLCDSDLHAIIYARESPLSPRHARVIAYQLLEALRHVHAAGVLHRDLKPSNVLVDEDCDVVLCDFGLARAPPPREARVPLRRPASPASDGHLLTEYVVTRWYRAPELLLANGCYDGAVDVWAAGCILAEMVRKRPLFPGKHVAHQVELVVSALRALEPSDFPAAFEGLTNGRARSFAERVRADASRPPTWASRVPDLDDAGVDVLAALLRFDAGDRATAARALESPYFAAARDYCKIHLARPNLDRTPLDASIGSNASCLCEDDVDVDLGDVEAAADVDALKRILVAREFKRTDPAW